MRPQELKPPWFVRGAGIIPGELADLVENVDQVADACGFDEDACSSSSCDLLPPASPALFNRSSPSSNSFSSFSWESWNARRRYWTAFS
mmetsp:Transcript_17791/g.17980  ORF Transcript_17791/g.17980 Transcript_17791/m.17980 type:complete len:89 (+) Transcript_17791:718-984(+)